MSKKVSNVKLSKEVQQQRSERRENGRLLAKKLKEEFRSFAGMRSYLLGVNKEREEEIAHAKANGTDVKSEDPRVPEYVIEILKLSRTPENYKYIRTLKNTKDNLVLASEQCDKVPLVEDGQLMSTIFVEGKRQPFYTEADVENNLADKATAKSKLAYEIQPDWTDYVMNPDGKTKMRDSEGQYIKRQDYANKYVRYQFNEADALGAGEHCRYVYSLSKFLSWAFANYEEVLELFRHNLEAYKQHQKDVKAEAKAKPKARRGRPRKQKAEAKAEKVEA